MKIAATLLCLCLLVSAGCGFRLRGDFQLPPELARTYVDGNARSALIVQLKRNLRDSNVVVVEMPAQDSARLSIFEENTGRRVVSVSRDGNAAEYQVYYRVGFRVALPGEEPGPDQQLQLRRDYVFDSEGVLSSSDEEQTLRTEMRRDLVRLIMLRLQTIGAQES